MSLNPQLGAAAITAGGLPVTNNANLSLPYASGGGGGSVGPNPQVSTLTISPNIGWVGTAGQYKNDITWTSTLTFSNGTNGGNMWLTQGVYDPTDVTLVLENTSETSVAYFGATSGGAYIQAAYNQPLIIDAPTQVSSLTVSSINGVAPGGASLFQSTFGAVPCPGNTSTVLMEMPAGQFGFNGRFIASGSGAYLSGFINTLTDLAGPNYYGALAPVTATQPPDSAPCVMTINEGDSLLSTVKLIVANNGSAAGAFTGVVSKLY